MHVMLNHGWLELECRWGWCFAKVGKREWAIERDAKGRWAVHRGTEGPDYDLAYVASVKARAKDVARARAEELNTRGVM